MALSLNDIKNKGISRDEKNPLRPKKTVLMPWQRKEEDPSVLQPADETVQSQIKAKLEPIQSQIEAESDPVHGQNGAKTKPERSRIGASAKPPIAEIGARIGAGSEPKRSQIESKSEPGTEPNRSQNFDLGDLSRLQIRCLQHVFESCRFSGSHTSERLFSGDISDALKSTPAAVKKAFQRLQEGAFVEREGFKKGPGGWTRYLLPKAVYKALSIREIRARSEPDRVQIGAKSEPGTEPGTEPSPLSSSSYIENNFKPTTTADVENARARIDVWTPEDLDYSMLVDTGFGRSQALQLRSLGLSFDVVQRSLVYFDFELRHTASGKSIQEPLALLMKRMRQNGCWEAPEEYTKRQTHFRDRFEDNERQIQEKASTAGANIDHQKMAAATLLEQRSKRSGR